jgi:hypothetical protein
MDSIAVESVDGEVFSVAQARTQSKRYKWLAWGGVARAPQGERPRGARTARRLLQRAPRSPALTRRPPLPRCSRPSLFLAGFAFLPLFWAVNAWLFYPAFRGGAGADPVVKKCEAV